MRHRRLARYYRAILLSFTSTILCIGAILCIWGGRIAARADRRELLTRTYENPGATLAIGAYIMIVAIVGFLGALAKKKALLTLFYVLLSFMVAAQFYAVIMLIVNRAKIKSYLRDHILDAVKRLNGRDDNFIINWLCDTRDKIIFDFIFYLITSNFLKLGTFLLSLCFFQLNY
ncbi:hypothetical protein Aperf_G00000068240 [Anoplocephala perfoliata]